MTDPRNQSRPAKPATCACYVVECPMAPLEVMGLVKPCARARLAITRRPEWGDIVAPPDQDDEGCPHWVGVEL